MIRAGDQLGFALQALRGHRVRTGLSMLGVAVGIAAVMLLSSVGEGTRRAVVAEFAQFGTNILGVHPGKTETIGIPGVFGGTTHKLTLDDAEALRRVRFVERVVPVAFGQARVEGHGRGRSVYVYGVTSDIPDVWKFRVRQGRFLPPGDPRRRGRVAVLGSKLKRELFGDANPLGQDVRVAGARLKVIGVMEPKGRLLGFDVDDAAYVPVATAMGAFDLDELHEIGVLFTNERVTDQVVAGVTRVLTARHGGEEDFTITTQTEMLRVFDAVLQAVTVAVTLIAAVSLVVGALGILTTMWIAVGERSREIGLLRALGATPGQVSRLFLLESVVLALLGGGLGVGVGVGIAALVRTLWPAFPLHVPTEFVALALIVSVLTGAIAGLTPARRAARLDPAVALTAR